MTQMGEALRRWRQAKENRRQERQIQILRDVSGNLKVLSKLETARQVIKTRGTNLRPLKDESLQIVREICAGLRIDLPSDKGAIVLVVGESIDHFVKVLEARPQSLGHILGQAVLPDFKSWLGSWVRQYPYLLVYDALTEGINYGQEAQMTLWGLEVRFAGLKKKPLYNLLHMAVIETLRAMDELQFRSILKERTEYYRLHAQLETLRASGNLFIGVSLSGRPILLCGV